MRWQAGGKEKFGGLRVRRDECGHGVPIGVMNTLQASFVEDPSGCPHSGGIHQRGGITASISRRDIAPTATLATMEADMATGDRSKSRGNEHRPRQEGEGGRSSREYPHSSGDRNTRARENDWPDYRGGAQRDADPDTAPDDQGADQAQVDEEHVDQKHVDQKHVDEEHVDEEQR